MEATYKHKSTGNQYWFIDTGIMKVNDKKWVECVIYKDEFETFVREKQDFLNKFEPIK